MGRRADGKCSRCGAGHLRRSALCAKCAYAAEKARRNGNGATRESQEEQREHAKDTFLTALIANGGHVMMACRTAKISRTTASEWRDADPDFAAMWESIQDANVERLEAEVDRRALGYQKELHHKGEPTGYTVTEYSDNLLMFRLKALRPDRYRDGPGASKNASNLSDSELDEALARMIARRAKALGKTPEMPLDSNSVN